VSSSRNAPRTQATIIPAISLIVDCCMLRKAPRVGGLGNHPGAMRSAKGVKPNISASHNVAHAIVEGHRIGIASPKSRREVLWESSATKTASPNANNPANKHNCRTPETNDNRD
jgi:hypothetical protein